MMVLMMVFVVMVLMMVLVLILLTIPPCSAMTTSNIRNWIRTADLEQLEMVVLEGHGHKLLSENASDNKIRQFLKSVPAYIVS